MSKLQLRSNNYTSYRKTSVCTTGVSYKRQVLLYLLHTEKKHLYSFIFKTISGLAYS